MKYINLNKFGGPEEMYVETAEIPVKFKL